MKKFFLLIILTTSFSSLYAWRPECPNLAKEIGGGWQESCKDARMSTYVCKLSAKCRAEDGSYKGTSIDTILVIIKIVKVGLKFQIVTAN